jgi:hypothetical protein
VIDIYIYASRNVHSYILEHLEDLIKALIYYVCPEMKVLDVDIKVMLICVDVYPDKGDVQIAAHRVNRFLNDSARDDMQMTCNNAIQMAWSKFVKKYPDAHFTNVNIVTAVTKATRTRVKKI